MSLPSGTVTFLFTDIEGSARLWEQYPDQMPSALAHHDALLREAIETRRGYVFKTVGDAFCAAFPTASDALLSALSAQQALQAASLEDIGSLRVRMALHTGAAEERDNDYFGPALNRVARLLSTGHGGQVLLSLAAAELTREALPSSVSLLSLGEHRLRDLNRPETVFQLLHPDLRSDFPPLKSLDNLPNNLPIQATSFVGREQEIAGVKALLSRSRLLTLTGSGGCGKTRLALQVAAEVLDRYPDGAWLVELASLSDAALIPQTLAAALAVKEEPGKPLIQTLTDALKPKRLLLVLDNCEHLLDACAQLAERLMGSCLAVSLVVTSREPLRIAGETTYRIPSLSLPDPQQAALPESLSQVEAVRLFLERAIAVIPAFAVNSQNAPAVAQICCRLGGIPLAIELAAARARSLTVEQIASRLDDRFHLLTGGSRTALPRQQTLQAALDWSYALLTEQERILLCRMSVFAGGWTLEAAERVCGDEKIDLWQVLDLLTALVDKSLVLFEEPVTGEGRYRLLETVRAYGQKRLAERDEAEDARRRHLAFFLALAEEAEPNLMGAEQQAWLDRLEREHDNLRAALRFGIEGVPGVARTETGDLNAPQVGLRMAGALSRFWWTRGLLSEGRTWLDAALAREETPAATKAQGKALNWSGVLAWMQGDYPAACALLEASLAVGRQIGDRRGIAASLDSLGLVAHAQSEYASARAFHEESLFLRREINDRGGIAASLHHLWNVAYCQGNYASAQTYLEEALAINREIGNRAFEANNLINLGNAAYQQGDCEAARAFYEEGLSIQRALGNVQGIASCLLNLGNVAYNQGDYASARACYEETLAIQRAIGAREGITHPLINLGLLSSEEGDCSAACAYLTECIGVARELGDKHAVCESLEAWAFLAKAQGQIECAARLWGVAEQMREGIGAPLRPKDKEQLERKAAEARKALDEKAFTAAWAEGRAMTLDQAVKLALQMSRQESNRHPSTG